MARPRHAGGRPPAFIPALVVEYAVKLYAQHRRWSEVLAQLERSGNGKYARNTLIRRVTRSSAVQNSDVDEILQPRRRRARAASKTRR